MVRAKPFPAIHVHDGYPAARWHCHREDRFVQRGRLLETGRTDGKDFLGQRLVGIASSFCRELRDADMESWLPR